MSNITAAMVKELRDITGAGMMECKKALGEAEGKVEEAVDILRTRGLASLAKKAGRATNEGAIATYVTPDSKTGALIEVNCETDFVATNAVFTEFVGDLAQIITENDPADNDALMALPYKDSNLTVNDQLGEIVGRLGENMAIARFERIALKTTGALATYVHSGAKIGIVVVFSFTNEATTDNDTFKAYARDVAMQVAAAGPIAVSRDDFDPAVVERERAIYKTQAAESGKPEQIQEKMAEGRLQKFFKEQALVEQAFVKDMDISIADLTAQVSKEVGDEITIDRFERFDLGE
ncbi:MAG: translation elongation factor Ts [Coriobacteriia bacterium]|nr:translation elongation factor Ts [Coriobacteriia bacterium]